MFKCRANTRLIDLRFYSNIPEYGHLPYTHTNDLGPISKSTGKKLSCFSEGPVALKTRSGRPTNASNDENS